MATALEKSPAFSFWVVCGFIAAFSLWLRTGFPVHAIPAASADDALFVTLARQLVAGHWLGPFNNTTLVKGMFYPLFIAIAFVVGIPLKIAEQAVYLAATALITGLIRRLWPNRRWFAWLAFCALALNPIVWTNELARVIREGLYIGLSLAVIGCSILASFNVSGDALPARGQLWSRVGRGLLAGIVGGCFWLTREEGVWLVPPVVCIVSVAIINAFAAWNRAGRLEPAHTMAWRLCQPWLAAICMMQIVVGTVAAINSRHYGSFETVEVKSSAFRHGYGALARIEPDRWQPYVMFPRDARIKAYRVSPAARELESSLDGPSGNAWEKVGCTQTGRKTCSEILAGWFQWALRDAVAAAGHYQTAATAAAYYTRLAAEIDTACLEGTLRCLAPRATLAPPFRLSYVRDALLTTPRLAGILLHPETDGFGVEPSQGTTQSNGEFADWVGPVMPSAKEERWLRGWVNARGGLPTLGERNSAGTPVSSAINVSGAPDVAFAFPGRQAVRFELRTACGDCTLAISVPNDSEALFPLAGLDVGKVQSQAGVTVFVDQSGTGEDLLVLVRRRIIMRIAGIIASFYGLLLPSACLFGCLGLVVGILRWARVPAALIALALASLVAVVARITLLAYLDVTAIPSINVLYASPAEPLLVVFALAGCWLGWLTAIVPTRPESDSS